METKGFASTGCLLQERKGLEIKTYKLGNLRDT